MENDLSKFFLHSSMESSTEFLFWNGTFIENFVKQNLTGNETLSLSSLSSSSSSSVSSSISSSSASPSSESFEGFSERQTFLISVTVPVLFALIVGIGLIGNVLVVIVVGSNAQMKSTTNQLITNLAIADLLFIVFCVPFTAWDYATSSWPFGREWCKICQYLIVVCAYASIYTLVLMSLDRYLAVAHPIRSISLRTSKYTHLALAIMWIVIILVCTPTMWMYNLVDAGPENYACRFLVDDYSEQLYQLNFFLLSFVIPIVVIIALYIGMLKRLWSNIAPGRNSAKSSENSMRSKRKVTRMVVIVVVIFTICWLPIQFLLLLKSFGLFPMNSSTVILQIFAQVFAYMNSCVNPILYVFLSENFRKGFTRIIARRSDGNCARTGAGIEHELASNGIRKKLATITTVTTAAATTTTTTTTQLNSIAANNGKSLSNCLSAPLSSTTTPTSPAGNPLLIVETSVQCIITNRTNGCSETTVAHSQPSGGRICSSVPFGITQTLCDTLL